MKQISPSYEILGAKRLVRSLLLLSYSEGNKEYSDWLGLGGMNQTMIDIVLICQYSILADPTY